MDNFISTVAPFAGYGQPTYTQIPDLFLDHQMQKLTGNAVKVMLYIFRHTYGYRKTCDAISYRQFVLGIVRADGQVIDQGAGISERGLAAALDELEEKGLIFRHLDFTTAGGRASTIYEINIDGQTHYQTGKTVLNRFQDPAVEIFEPGVRLDVRKSQPSRPAGQSTAKQKKRDTSAKIADTPTAKIADTPTAKIADTPTAKIAVTINNRINKQQNNTHGGTAIAVDDVTVDLLIRAGVTQEMAENLVTLAISRGRIPGYVAQWVSYATSRPDILNVVGYLIRMIRGNIELPEASQTLPGGRSVTKPAKNPIDFSKYQEGGKYGFVSKPVSALVE